MLGSTARLALLCVPLLALACSTPGDSAKRKAVPTSSDSVEIARTRDIVYQAGGAVLRGYLALPEDTSDTRPGVLVVHEWWGHNEYARRRARELSDLGYVAFALDMYGDGKSADHPEDAGAFMAALMENRQALEMRFRAGLATLLAQPEVDAEDIAVIGYCMGGGIALDMARAGLDVDAVVSFHGLLGANAKARVGAVGADLLVLTGEDDPMAPAEAREAFEAEMTSAGADYRMVVYPGVVHAFTNPKATEVDQTFDMGGALRYDAEADADSWERMKAFLADAFSDDE